MPEPTADFEERSRPPILLAVVVGFAVALAAIGVVFSIIAIPLFALARFTEPGHGLVGLRERITVCGGRLETGPRAGGGYEVRALLPMNGE